jgi:hypothetical protein
MAETTLAEPRWPPMLAIIAVLFLLEVLPQRIRLLPAWAPYVISIAAIAPMVAVTLAPASARWANIERAIVLLFVAIATALTVVGLANLIRMTVSHPEISGIRLLTSSIAVWGTNVLMFSLLYWQIDRGGPTTRAGNVNIKPDWLFPQEGAPEDVPPGWRLSYVDYLFLGYSTATAFSPTDALPLTSRAKMLMMLESTISLLTIVIVGARAINIMK